MTELLLLLSLIGSNVPDCQPACNNYYQDIGLGFDCLNNESRFFPAEREAEFSYFWEFQDSIYFGECIPFNELDLDCQGIFPVGLYIVHYSGALFYREIPAFIFYQNDYLPECEYEDLTIIDVWSFQIWEDFTPYQYLDLHSPVDYDMNNEFNVYDLLICLSNY